MINEYCLKIVGNNKELTFFLKMQADIFRYLSEYATIESMYIGMDDSDFKT